MLTSRIVRGLVVSVVLPSAVACVHYRRASVDPAAMVASAPLPPKGPIAYDDAVRWALAHDPDLLALRARAAAVNLSPTREPIEAEAGRDSDGRKEGAVTIDALSLLGLGTRPAELALACARRSEAWLRHHERAREIAGEIARTFAVEQALTALPTPTVPLDAEAYVRAGLEAGAARGAVASTDAQSKAELAARDEERARNRRALCRLLGVGPGTDVVPAPVDAAWPAVPTATPAALLVTRGDVQRSLAEFETADAELRRAVALQYPSLLLTPGLALNPATFFGSVGVRLPIGAAPEARAAEQAREAARQEVASLLLDGMQRAADARDAFALADVRVETARTRVASDQELFRAAKAHLETGTGTMLETIFAGREVVDASTGIREAIVEAAKARVEAARAAGWPSAEAVR